MFRYAQGLIDAGHEVRFVVLEEARDRVEKRGFTFVSAGHPPDDEMAAAWEMLDKATAEEAVPVAIRHMFGGVLSRQTLPKVRDMVETWKPDLIVRESCEFSGLAVSEEAGIPCAMVSVVASGGMQHFHDLFQDTANDMRDFAVVSRGEDGSREVVLCDFPASLDKNCRILGRVPVRVAPSGSAVEPVAGEEGWLPGEGRKLLYVTLGTISGRSPRVQEAFRQALGAVADLDADVLLTIGRVMDPDLLGAIPDNVTVERFVPQKAIFSVATAVAHHGGSGTFSGTLAAGLPQVILPLFADQPFNASSAAEAGVAISVTDRTVGNLHAAFKGALSDEALAQRAREVAVEMAAMTPMPALVRQLEEMAR